MCNAASDLTQRELEVIRLLVDGLSNQEIADGLGLSRRTVQAHVANAMARTQTRSRTQLAVFALRNGIVPLGPPDTTDAARD
jgi:DNA-binding NarL/FixJ family response regulator